MGTGDRQLLRRVCRDEKYRVTVREISVPVCSEVFSDPYHRGQDNDSSFPFTYNVPVSGNRRYLL